MQFECCWLGIIRMGSQLSVLLLQAQQNQEESDQRVAKAESEANEAQQKVEREAAQTMQAAAGEKETLEELRRRASKEIEVHPYTRPAKLQILFCVKLLLRMFTLSV